MLLELHAPSAGPGCCTALPPPPGRRTFGAPIFVTPAQMTMVPHHPTPHCRCTVQVAAVASHLHHACSEHYLAYMGLLSEVSAHASVVLRALWQ